MSGVSPVWAHDEDGSRATVNPSLLARCALLRWFDADLLTASGLDQTLDPALLCAGSLTVPIDEQIGLVRLTDEAQAVALARQGDADPIDEVALHSGALAVWQRRLEGWPAGPGRHLGEQACLYHLGELRELLARRRDWRRLAELVAAVRALPLTLARSRSLLDLHEGFVAIRLQEYERGETLLTRLVETPTVEPDIRMGAFRALGNGYWLQTRWDQALAMYERSHALACELGDRFHQASALINLSMTYQEVGYYDQALALATESRALFEMLGDHASEAHALWEMGRHLMRLGRWPAARQTLAEAVERYMALGITAPLANLYWCQGFVAVLTGDLATAETAYHAALQVASSATPVDHSATRDVLRWLGILYQIQGAWEKALTCLDQASEAAHQVRSPYHAALILGNRGDVLCRQEQTDAALVAYGQAIDRIESLRGSYEQEKIKIGLLGTVHQLYEAQVLLCLRQGRTALAFEYVERARSRAFLDALARKAPALYERVDRPIATLAEVQARLDPDTLLIEFFTTGVLPQGEHFLGHLPEEHAWLREHLLQPPTIVIFAITHDQVVATRAALDPNVLRPPLGDPAPGRRFLHDHLLRRLYDRLIGPVAQLLTGRRQLYLIPHGPLHYVPFMALRSGTGRYLLDAQGPAVAMAPSATILIRTCLGPRPAPGGLTLALGYDDPDGAMLAYAEREAALVAQQHGGEVWTGPSPKSQRLLEVGPRLGRLHIAGHAVFDPHDPLASRLRLGVDDELSAQTVLEQLQLGAELVTLSACTTGLSHVMPGDELLGLPRAFLYAGVPTVVGTLWEANDLVARLVCEHFYAQVDRLGPARALGAAQIAVREMHMSDVRATLQRWHEVDPSPLLSPEMRAWIELTADDAQPFSEPLAWAPFMVIGRGAWPDR